MKNKNKVNQTRAAQIYSRAVQKVARKFPYLSPDEAKADRQRDSLHPLNISDAELVGLAWQINPDLCKNNLDAAIKLTMQTLMVTRKARRKALADLVAEELTAAHQRDEEERIRRLDSFHTRGHSDYYYVVKCITDEKNWDRALDKIKRFETARGAVTQDALEKVLAVYRNKIFTGTELLRLWGEYRQWWEQEKSRLAKEAGQARKGGQGRVRKKKSDLRFKENRRRKQGYCRNCGRRVRTNEHLCDDCISGKPLLSYPGMGALLRASDEPGDENVVGRY